MRVTETHVQLWLQRKGPAWMRRIPKAQGHFAELRAAQLIDRCVNAHAGQAPTRGEQYATQLCGWVKSWQRRMGQYPVWHDLHVSDLASEFYRLANSPHAYQAPRRSAYARRWYYRLQGMKPPRVRR